MSTASVAVCTNHPGREAIGVCVKCRTRVCSECSTKVDGINYCVACLAGLAVAGGRSAAAPRRGSAPTAYLAAFGYLLLLSAGVFALLQVLLPGG